MVMEKFLIGWQLLVVFEQDNSYIASAHNLITVLIQHSTCVFYSGLPLVNWT